MSTVMSILLKKYHPEQYALQQEQEEELIKQTARNAIIARYKLEASSESKKDTTPLLPLISKELRQILNLLNK